MDNSIILTASAMSWNIHKEAHQVMQRLRSLDVKNVDVMFVYELLRSSRQENRVDSVVSMIVEDNGMCDSGYQDREDSTDAVAGSCSKDGSKRVCKKDRSDLELTSRRCSRSDSEDDVIEISTDTEEEFDYYMATTELDVLGNGEENARSTDVLTVDLTGDSLTGGADQDAESEILEENNNDPNNNLDAAQMLLGSTSGLNRTMADSDETDDDEEVSSNAREEVSPRPGCSKNPDTGAPAKGHYRIGEEAMRIHAILPRFKYTVIYDLLMKYRCAKNRIELVLWDLLPERKPQPVYFFKRKQADDICTVEHKKPVSKAQVRAKPVQEAKTTEKPVHEAKTTEKVGEQRVKEESSTTKEPDSCEKPTVASKDSQPKTDSRDSQEDKPTRSLRKEDKPTRSSTHAILRPAKLVINANPAPVLKLHPPVSSSPILAPPKLIHVSRRNKIPEKSPLRFLTNTEFGLAEPDKMEVDECSSGSTVSLNDAPKSTSTDRLELESASREAERQGTESDQETDNEMVVKPVCTVQEVSKVTGYANSQSVVGPASEPASELASGSAPELPSGSTTELASGSASKLASGSASKPVSGSTSELASETTIELSSGTTSEPASETTSDKDSETTELVSDTASEIGLEPTGFEISESDSETVPETSLARDSKERSVDTVLGLEPSVRVEKVDSELLLEVVETKDAKVEENNENSDGNVILNLPEASSTVVDVVDAAKAIQRSRSSPINSTDNAEALDIRTKTNVEQNNAEAKDAAGVDERRSLPTSNTGNSDSEESMHVDEDSSVQERSVLSSTQSARAPGFFDGLLDGPSGTKKMVKPKDTAGIDEPRSLPISLTGKSRSNASNLAKLSPRVLHLKVTKKSPFKNVRSRTRHMSEESSDDEVTYEEKLSRRYSEPSEIPSRSENPLEPAKVSESTKVSGSTKVSESTKVQVSTGARRKDRPVVEQREAEKVVARIVKDSKSRASRSKMANVPKDRDYPLNGPANPGTSSGCIESAGEKNPWSSQGHDEPSTRKNLVRVKPQMDLRLYTEIRNFLTMNINFKSAREPRANGKVDETFKGFGDPRVGHPGPSKGFGDARKVDETFKGFREPRKVDETFQGCGDSRAGQPGPSKGFGDPRKVDETSKGFGDPRVGHPGPSKGFGGPRKVNETFKGFGDPRTGHPGPSQGFGDPRKVDETFKGFGDPRTGYPGPSQGFGDPRKVNETFKGFGDPRTGHPGPSQGFGDPRTGHPGPSQGFGDPRTGHPGPFQEFADPRKVNETFKGFGDPRTGHPGPSQGFGDPRKVDETFKGFGDPRTGHPGPSQGFGDPRTGHPGPSQGFGDPRKFDETFKRHRGTHARNTGSPRGPGHSHAFHGPARGPGHSHAFHGPARGRGGSHAFHGPTRGRGGSGASPRFLADFNAPPADPAFPGQPDDLHRNQHALRKPAGSFARNGRHATLQASGATRRVHEKHQEAGSSKTLPRREPAAVKRTSKLAEFLEAEMSTEQAAKFGLLKAGELDEDWTREDERDEDDEHEEPMKEEKVENSGARTLSEKKQKIFMKLMSMFPHVSSDYIHSLCAMEDSEGEEDEDETLCMNSLVDHLLGEGEKNPRARRKDEKTREMEHLDEQYANLMGFLPNADPEYLREVAETMYRDPDAMEQFVQAKLEKPDYPTREQYLERRRISEQQKRYTTEFSVQRFLEIFPDPFKHFEDPGRKQQFDQAAFDFVKNRFPDITVDTLMTIYKQNNYNLSLVVKQMERTLPSNSQRRTRDPDNPLLIESIPLLQEVAFVENKNAIRRYLTAAKENESREFAYLKRTSGLLQCMCCYDDECMPSKCNQCDDGHVFCHECIKRGTDARLAEGQTRVPCFLECDSEFGLSVLQRILSPTKFSILLRKRQEAEVMAAGVEGLVSCPFCHFASIPPPEDKVFTCLNPECMKESCRLCKRPNHVPLTCDEVDPDKMRHVLEESMTKALVRECHRCKRPFFKEEGCNKMSCPCGAQMCYICDKPVNGYTHFNGQGSTRIDLCPLWSDSRRINAESVQQVAKKTMEDLKRRNPQLKIDTTGLLPNVPAAEAGPQDDIPNANELPQHARDLLR